MCGAVCAAADVCGRRAWETGAPEAVSVADGDVVVLREKGGVGGMVLGDKVRAVRLVAGIVYYEKVCICESFESVGEVVVARG